MKNERRKKNKNKNVKMSKVFALQNISTSRLYRTLNVDISGAVTSNRYFRTSFGACLDLAGVDDEGGVGLDVNFRGLLRGLARGLKSSGDDWRINWRNNNQLQLVFCLPRFMECEMQFSFYKRWPLRSYIQGDPICNVCSS